MTIAFVPLSSGEVYDPATDSWSPVGPMTTGHAIHTATLLNDGRVLVVGGWGSEEPSTPVAEVFDPATAMRAAAGVLPEGRFDHAAILLSDGRVLVAGGDVPGGSAEVPRPRTAFAYDPASNTWLPAGTMSVARKALIAARLRDGRVLVFGGDYFPYEYPASSEIFDPRTNAWTVTGAPEQIRWYGQMASLPDGRVFVTGGCCQSSYVGGGLASTEIYTPATECTPDVTPFVQTYQSGVGTFFIAPLQFQLAFVRNATTVPIPGPLAFVMNGLRNGLPLNTSGWTWCVPPPGGPFVTVRPGLDNVLSPGEIAPALLLFLHYAPDPITYTPRILSGIPGS